MIKISKEKLKIAIWPTIAFCLGMICMSIFSSDDCFKPKPNNLYSWEQYEQGVGEHEIPVDAFFRPDYDGGYDIEKEGCKNLRLQCADEISHMIRGKHIYEMRYECQAYIHECI